MTPAAHTHAASDVTSGTLPVARGGTGVNNIASLKSVLGIGSKVFNPTVIYSLNIDLTETHNYQGNTLIASLGTAFTTAMQYDVIGLRFVGTAIGTAGSSSSKYHTAGLTLSTASNSCSIADAFIVWSYGINSDSASNATFTCDDIVYFYRSSITHTVSDGDSNSFYAMNGDSSWVKLAAPSSLQYDLYLYNQSN